MCAAKRLVKKKAGKLGLPPGTLVHLGERSDAAPNLRVLRYDHERLDEFALASPQQLADHPPAAVTWINLDGLHQIELVEQFGTVFGLHPLVLEDILNTDHRPKLEVYDGYLFCVVKMLSYDAGLEEIATEQVSLVLGPGYVLSFQEKPGDVFDGLRQRVRVNKGRLRRMGADYLAYALLDTLVDHYFLVLEKIGDQIERLEDELVANPTTQTLHKIHNLKREMILLRKSVWPLREVISGLQREESELVTAATDLFWRDLYDHTIQVVDTVETFRDIITGMLDLYLSSVSNRMNEIMKVLTIMATIFIPLTFIAGVYGMNFDYLPELKWHYGYFGVWAVMLATVAAMLLFFRRKKWL